MDNIEKLEKSIERIIKQENIIYLLVHDTKGNAKASVKYIYDLAKTLIDNGKKAVILVEDNQYTNINTWIDGYDEIPIKSIKEDKININIDDILVIPEIYFNILPQFKNVNCEKIALIQQQEYLFETLPLGAKLIDYGVFNIITTNETTRLYLSNVFKHSLLHVIPPIFGDEFKPLEESIPKLPIIALHNRNREKNKKIIHEFYLKYPDLRWITFRDMVQMSYNEFAENLKMAMCAVWVDDINTFGTFPVECMLTNTPIIGKIPNNKPEWLDENGYWVSEEHLLTDVISNFIYSWLSDVKIKIVDDTKINDVKNKYTTDKTRAKISNVFTSINNKKLETLNKTLDNIKTQK